MLRKLTFLIVLICLTPPLRAQTQVPILSGAVIIDASKSNTWKVILTSNVSGVTLTNPRAGQIIYILFTQDSTGGRTVTFGGNINTSLSVTSTAGVSTLSMFEYDGNVNTWFTISGGGGGATPFSGAPTGTCAATQTAVDTTSGTFYSCNNGTWLLGFPGAAGSAAYNTITSGTSLSQAFVMGNGSQLSATGTGIINATTMSWAGLTGFPTVCGTNLFAKGVGLALNCTQPAFSNLSGTISLAQTQLTTNGDVLGVSGGVLARIASAMTINTTSPMTGGGSLALGGSLTLGTPTCVASGASHAAGLVPDPGSSVGTTRFLREDCTFAAPAGTGTVTTSGSPVANGVAYLTSASAITSVTPPTANGTYSLVYSVTGGVAVPPTPILSGIPYITHTTSATLDYSYRSTVHEFGTAASATLALPAMGSGNLASNLALGVTNVMAGDLTVSATSPDSFNGSVGGSHVVHPNWFSLIYQDTPNTNWKSATFPRFGAFPDCSVALTFTAATGVFGCGSGTTTTFQTNGTGLTSSSTVNFLNSAAFNGVTFGFSNPSAGQVKLTASGSFANTALANSSIAVNTAAPMTGGGTVALGAVLNISTPAFVASGASHAAGLVPDPGSSAGTTKFLREDATFAVPAGGSTPSFPVTVAGTVTSGGIPYFSSTTVETSSAALTANMPVIGGGAGVAPSVGTVTGNTTEFPTWTGAATANRCVHTDASGNLLIAPADCSSGGGGTTVQVAGSGVSSTINMSSTTPAPATSNSGAVNAVITNDGSTNNNVSAVVSGFIPRPNNRRTTRLSTGGTTTLAGYGESPNSQGGTYVYAAPNANDGPMITINTGATINTNAGFAGATFLYRVGFNILWQSQVSIVDTTSMRVMFGLTTATVTTTFGSATPTGHLAMFRYDTSASDAKVHCITGNGTTTTDDGTTGVTALDANSHKYEISFDDTVPTVTFKIDGTAVCGSPITTTIPASGQNLWWIVGAQDLTAVTKAMRLGGVYVETDK